MIPESLGNSTNVAVAGVGAQRKPGGRASVASRRFSYGHPAIVALLSLSAAAVADDWPQWRGPRRDGVWREADILEEIPADGLRIRWRARVGPGYSGPVVAEGRVFITDRRLDPPVERVLCFDEASGESRWIHAYPCDYANMDFGSGPRASPTVHAGKVYTLGARADLYCLDGATGAVVWEKDLINQYAARVPRYGVSAAPLVEDDLLIVCVGSPQACVVAFDRITGEERWRAIDDLPAYSAPIVTTAGGCRQLIVWTAEMVSSLDPQTGRIYWHVPFKTSFDDAQVVATPVRCEDRLLCLAAWNRGSLMLQLARDRPAATELWRTRSQPTTTISTPLFPNEDNFYAIVSDGSLACLDANTGEELWHTEEPTGSTPLASAHLTPNGDRVFLFNQKGHLIVARLTPEGYEKISQSLLIEPTAGFRPQGPVTWAHPAYANRHVFARNDRELVSASLAADQPATDVGAAERLVTGSRTVGESAANQAVLTCALSPNGRLLAAGIWGGNIRLLDVETGTELPAPPKHRNWVCSLAFSPDGNLLVSAGGNEFMQLAELRLWDIAAGAERARLEGHLDKVLSVAFSPDGATLATASADHTVRLWDVRTLTQRAILSGHTDAVWSVAFSPDSQTLASAGYDRTVRLWDVATGTERMRLAGHNEEVLAVAISPDSQTLATGSADWTSRLWDLSSGDQRAVFEGHHGAVHCLAFSADGATLASGSGDETIRLWDVALGTTRATFRGHQSTVSAVAFSPDGTTLYSSGTDDGLRSWEVPWRE